MAFTPKDFQVLKDKLNPSLPGLTNPSALLCFQNQSLQVYLHRNGRCF